MQKLHILFSILLKHRAACVIFPMVDGVEAKWTGKCIIYEEYACNLINVPGRIL
jgi:hypothetical protein